MKIVKNNSHNCYFTFRNFTWLGNPYVLVFSTLSNEQILMRYII